MSSRSRAITQLADNLHKKQLVAPVKGNQGHEKTRQDIFESMTARKGMQ